MARADHNRRTLRLCETVLVVTFTFKMPFIVYLPSTGARSNLAMDASAIWASSEN
jgi:hypothetical protein